MPCEFFPRIARRLLACLGLWLSLTFRAHGGIEHVLLISVDGLRGDFIESVMNTASEEVPNFLRLRNAGASTCNARCDAGMSITNPNHICMITGRPATAVAGLPDTVFHGYLFNGTADDTIHNGGNPAVPYKASIFDVVHDAGLSTAGYMSKFKLGLLIRSYDETNGAPDVTGPDNGRNKVDAAYYADTFDGANDALIAAIQNGDFKNFTMLHYLDTDFAGHGAGWTIEEGSPYRAAIRAVDGKLGKLVDAIEANPTYAGHTAIILTADHGGGGGDFFNHADNTLRENACIPFFLIAPGITPGTDVYEWMENRFNPQAEVPDYTVPSQPIRNGDAGNLAAALLGVPSIPGSLMHPVLKRPLQLALGPGDANLSWPLYLTGYTLESSDDLARWRPIVSGLREEPSRCCFRDAGPLPRGRFYRLRAPYPDL